MLLNAIVASILKIILRDLEKIPIRNMAGKRPSLCKNVIEIFWSAIMAYCRSSEREKSLSVTFSNEVRSECGLSRQGAGAYVESRSLGDGAML